jgi:hypothetical protein
MNPRPSGLQDSALTTTLPRAPTYQTNIQIDWKTDIATFHFFFYFSFFYSCCSHLEHKASVKPFVSLQFLNLRQSVGLLGREISPSQDRYLTQTQNKHRQTSMPWVGFELTIPVFERAKKTFHVLARSATVIGSYIHTFMHTYKNTNTHMHVIVCIHIHIGLHTYIYSPTNIIRTHLQALTNLEGKG